MLNRTCNSICHSLLHEKRLLKSDLILLISEPELTENCRNNTRESRGFFDSLSSRTRWLESWRRAPGQTCRRRSRRPLCRSPTLASCRNRSSPWRSMAGTWIRSQHLPYTVHQCFLVSCFNFNCVALWLPYNKTCNKTYNKIFTILVLVLVTFYRAMHFSAYARSWDRMSSVCPSVRLSVRPSVTLVDCDHIGRKSWKLITRATSPTPSLFVAKRRSA